MKLVSNEYQAAAIQEEICRGGKCGSCDGEWKPLTEKKGSALYLHHSDDCDYVRWVDLLELQSQQRDEELRLS